MKVCDESINKAKAVGWFDKEFGLPTAGYEVVILIKATFKNTGGGGANGDNSLTRLFCLI